MNASSFPRRFITLGHNLSNIISNADIVSEYINPPLAGSSKGPILQRRSISVDRCYCRNVEKSTIVVTLRRSAIRPPSG